MFSDITVMEYVPPQTIKQTNTNKKLMNNLENRENKIYQLEPSRSLLRNRLLKSKYEKESCTSTIDKNMGTYTPENKKEDTSEIATDETDIFKIYIKEEEHVSETDFDKEPETLKIFIKEEAHTSETDNEEESHSSETNFEVEPDTFKIFIKEEAHISESDIEEEANTSETDNEEEPDILETDIKEEVGTSEIYIMEKADTPENNVNREVVMFENNIGVTSDICTKEEMTLFIDRNEDANENHQVDKMDFVWMEMNMAAYGRFAKTAVQRMRDYRESKKLSQENNTKVAKTSTQRSRECRQRKKLRQACEEKTYDIQNSAVVNKNEIHRKKISIVQPINFVIHDSQRAGPSRLDVPYITHNPHISGSSKLDVSYVDNSDCNKVSITAVQRMREYCEYNKITQENIKVAKTSTERSRECRARKKLRKAIEENTCEIQNSQRAGPPRLDVPYIIHNRQIARSSKLDVPYVDNNDRMELSQDNTKVKKQVFRETESVVTARNLDKPMKKNI